MPVNDILADGTEALKEHARRGAEANAKRSRGREKIKRKDGDEFLYEPPKPSIVGARVVQGWRNKP